MNFDTMKRYKVRRNFIILLLVTLLSVTSCSFTTKDFDEDSDKDKVLIELITYVIEQGHFDMKEIDDEFSEAVFKDYIQGLDPIKRHFLASDFQDFEAFKTQIDDQIENKNLVFFNLTVEILTQRMEEAKEFYSELLTKPFNFQEEEVINTDYEKQDYASSKSELKKRWRQQFKFSTLSSFHELKEEQAEKIKNGEEVDKKSDVELEKDAREITKESIENYFDAMSDLERKDWFSLYINSVVSQFDPHTNYFAPQDKDRFDISMSGKLEGIGARLQKQRDNVKIVEVISGGPAWTNGELEVGDLIQKVKQEDEEEPVDIRGMRLDDAVDLIKGPKGTKVTLTVKKVDGSSQTINITRDIVEIEETYAKSSSVIKNGKSYGVINLPKFYFDMQDYDERNAASDIKKELIRLNEIGAEGLVIDLRNNGGGSLSTVVDIAGFFIENGPVVQVRDAKNNTEVLKDTDADVIWDKPLVILVNELSASASEILAAAMQDYNRAVVIGSKQTYGKGTVQNVVDLNRWMRNNSTFGDMGALKITTQKFYRINGGSTQLKGVESDVAVPDRYSYIDIGERDYENPMPWDKIAPADYKAWRGYSNLEKVIASSRDRLSNNAQIQLIDENAKWINAQRNQNSYSLNYDSYDKEMAEVKNMSEKFDNINNYKTDLTYSSLPYEESLMAQDSSLTQKRKRWHESLSKDVYVQEAINVLQDLNVDESSIKLAARKD
ncbi:carboxy-terminal processing protease [Psychroflexus torquis ATCC 700755]|uniref:Carboxy-terminal processing protease n=1 Tax=Psychroflexus torquis (strain ATCC 700755 / CIP 106069 / ACAM 623) TaxID=313595 RepID=K4ICT1_PSYTT|nr:carboxy terminal-processing peptidase [Psychroflexus torquis]AFU68219.1 carboxy-terminal processing protease [Psychroflexus torquis ATCC 700755]